MRFNCCFLLIQAVLLIDVESINILGIFPHPGKSHFDVFEPLMTKLAELGHDVTVISFFPKRNPMPRYTDIDMTGTTPIITNSLDMDLLMNLTRITKYLSVNFLAPYAEETCNTLASKQIQDFLKSDAKFDLVIVELFATNCYLGLLHKVKAPFIFFSSSAMVPWASQNFGNIDNPAYIPTLFMDFTRKMDFFQRVENSIVYVINKILHQIMLEDPANDSVNQHVSADAPLVEDTARNASLFLVNSHYTLFGARPLVPNIIEVGGIHIKEMKPLAKVTFCSVYSNK
ncbi:UDP-glycosyltransferase family 36 member D1 [Carabus blaptoides fortunei]